MHELGLLTSVVAAVQRAANDAHNVTRVTEVTLKVGAWSGAVTEALHGSWQIAILDTICANALLQVIEIPATVFCPKCDKNIEVDEFFALLCPVCSTPTGQLTHGREFEIESVTWETS